MPSFEMNEIRIPSALMRERRPSVLFTVAKSTFTAVLLAVISFFFLNVLAISGLAIASAFRHERLDFAMAYRNFAAPAAMGIFLIVWVAALIFFFRERGR
jgi:hypothetical protein